MVNYNGLLNYKYTYLLCRRETWLACEREQGVKGQVRGAPWPDSVCIVNYNSLARDELGLTGSRLRRRLRVTTRPRTRLQRILTHWIEECIHRRFIYKGDTSTHTQGTDPRVALGAYGELPWIYIDAWGGSRCRDPSGHFRRRPAA